MSNILKKGSKGDLVKVLQLKLGLKPDGNFGKDTENAVKEFQKKNKLVADGVAGPKTLEAMQISIETNVVETPKPTQPAKKSAVKENKDPFEILPDGTLVNLYMLPENEYRHDMKIRPQYLFLHHTAGWQNPYKVVDGWIGDKVGRVATQYVIGGQSIKGNDDTQDGVIIKCMPDESYAGHLGAVNSREMHVNSIGIELCSFGQLTFNNGKYITYTGTEVDPSQVITLSAPFKGYKHFHKYSKKQIDAAIALLKYLGKKYNIDLKKGLVEFLSVSSPNDSFNYKEAASSGQYKGILSHGNVRRDKIDVYPDPYLIEQLKNL